jgi:hypothetical protein
LDVQTKWIIFDWIWVTKIKEKSNDFNDKERLEAFRVLENTSWDMTNDYDSIENVLKEIRGLSHEEQQKIKKWEIKRIVISLSDWWSSKPYVMKEKIKTLRGYWVLVYWVWITISWEPVVDLYSWKDEKLWYGMVCEEVTDLAKVLKDLLKEHLKNI